ncbi:SAM-dependent RNA methyltransferase [Zopfochytrium polystomum]|nr:SAM-dependent RNA methyltransferase [Zopfochytrium polystomum]
MKFIVEHMEEGLTEWVILEYRHMIKNLGKGNLILSGMTPSTIASAPADIRENAELTEKTVLQFADKSKVLLLDPASPDELVPEDGTAGFEYLLFGGILGDDPPQDRTRLLRQLGFATRHLGKHQMTTDTAVIVSKVVTGGTRLGDIPFVDRPEIKLGKHESVEMPFRYILENGAPKLPDGFKELLRRTNDATFDAL